MIGGDGAPDISLVFNLHNETTYLRRTVNALEEAVRYGQSFGLTFELIVVLDRAAASTKQWIAACDFSAFDSLVVTECEHGSLGLARNEGIKLARGAYIGTVDADDLMSFNMFHEFYLMARSHGAKAIVIQQYVVAFGYESFMVEYLGTDRVSKLGFFSYHPSVSRIFAHRSLFERLSYSDAKLTSGYAYEDWHFACDAMALDYELVVARGTIMFYRQRPNSLLRNADQMSVRQIPPTMLFEPQTFLAVCAKDFERYRKGEFDLKDPGDTRKGFDENPTCWELTRAVGAIDPAVTIHRPTEIAVYTNLTRSIDAGAAYFRIAKLIAGRRFTDVVLLPFISTGGGDKYILDVLEGLSMLDPERSFLILTGEAFAEHAWTDRLPATSVFLDLHKICHGCTELELQLVTLRLLENAAGGATIHIKSSVYAVRFIEKFNAVLKSYRLAFYRFSDPHYANRNIIFCAGYVFNFLSEYGALFWRVITDNESIAQHDKDRFDALADRWRTLRAQCLTRARADLAAPNRRPRKRLLWASRLDPEKRPELLLKIADALASKMPEVSIEVYGSSVMEPFDVARFACLANVSYKGAFTSFDQIDAGRYDAFVYTTAFDGLPNVVLEAMASGLPVIASDIGGLGEVVRSGETGWLLNDQPDEASLVADYIAAIESAYAPSTDLVGLQTAASAFVRARHSREQFLDTLRDIFEVAAQTEDPAVPDDRAHADDLKDLSDNDTNKAAARQAGAPAMTQA